MSETLQALSEALQRAELPAEMAELSGEELQTLLRSVEALKKHQETELDRAVEDALSHIPGLLRRSVRKMLFS